MGNSFTPIVSKSRSEDGSIDPSINFKKMENNYPRRGDRSFLNCVLACSTSWLECDESSAAAWGSQNVASCGAYSVTCTL